MANYTIPIARNKQHNYFLAKKSSAIRGAFLQLCGLEETRKRAIIETVNDELKNIWEIEHTIHRSFDNFLSNLLSGLIAYSFFPKKPSLNLEIIDKKLSA